MSKKPIVLTISGHDPSGGAGIQADIETISALGCQPCAIISCLTVQDSSTVSRLIPLNAHDIAEQAAVLLNDMPPAVIKIGLCGSIGVVETIADILKNIPNTAVVFDPVLAGGDGNPLANDALVAAIKTHLIPLTTVLTPNTLEAAKLSGLATDDTLEHIAMGAQSLDASYVLMTGGHQQGRFISNRLFHQQQLISQLKWPRQNGQFHGTGCTLASAIAAYIALGLPILDAVEQAQRFTHDAVKHAHQPGKGQAFLNRQAI